MDELEQAEFEMEALLLTVVEIVEGAEDDLEVAGDLFFREEQGSTGGTSAFVAGDLEELGLLAADFGHEGVAEVADHLAGERRGAVAGVDEQVELLHQLGALAGGYSFKQALEDGVGDRAHELANLRGGEDGAIVFDGRGGDGLIHDGERIAHGAVAGFGKQGERGVFGGDFFLPGNHLELGEDVVEFDGVKAEVLAAGADGLGNVFWLRGGHHEDDVGGRLLECLEQRVEGGVGDLVSFVEDIDFVAVAGGGVAGGVAEFADFVDAAIGGGVDFDDVDGVALADFDAGIADAARLGGWALGRSRRRFGS